MMHLHLFLVFVACTTVGTAYGHGLGLDTISSIDVGDRKLSITVEMPLDFDQDQRYITITASDDDTDEPVPNVTFLIGLYHDDTMIFRNYFFAKDGILYLTPIPTDDPEITIHGTQDSILGAWHGTNSDPIEITGPLLNSGGLYTFEIEIRTIDEPTNIIESDIYYADLSVTEVQSFIQTDSQGDDVKFRTKSYFDKIHDLNYVPAARQVTFEMPFDWSEDRMSHIPVVHEEIHFPNDFVEFLSPSYTGYVNGIKLFKESVVIDDYTEDDERIVHFVLLQDHLRLLKRDMQSSDQPLPQSMLFKLEANEEISFPLTAYTISEDFAVNLAWDPIELEPETPTNFVFTIRDGKTNEPLRNSAYTFIILQNDQELYRSSGVAQIGGQFEKFTFAEEQTGPTTIKFEDIRNTGQDTEFRIVVVPEFGGLAILIMIISLTGIIVATRRYV